MAFRSDYKFELIHEVHPGTSLAVRADDRAGQRYIARRLDQYVDKSIGLDMQQLMNNERVAPLACLPLHHENIVSIVGHIRQEIINVQQPPQTEEYLVWDYCDAANLSALYADHPSAEKSSAYYLPEGLCWHVLRALIKAVTYLHDGKRWVYDCEATEATKLRKWQSTDGNWRAILHREIEPDNIFFQHPTGEETYGACKLGNFSQAAVTAHIVGSSHTGHENEAGGAGFAVACKRGWEPKLNTLAKLDKNPGPIDEGDRLYTLREELWSIGSVVFTMMTGRKLTLCCEANRRSHVVRCSVGGCVRCKAKDEPRCDCVYGGCTHLPSSSCHHEVFISKQCRSKRCNEDFVNIDEHLARGTYSRYLRDRVKALLAYEGKNPQEGLVAEAHPFAESVEAAFWQWRRLTNEGQYYQDIEDEFVEFWVQEKSDRAESILDVLVSQHTWETV